jgi:Helicase associated domain
MIDLASSAQYRTASHLITYKEREGHCRVPVKHEENGFSLGPWVYNQRTNKDGLSKERRQGLEKIGVAWDVQQGRF